MKKKYIKKLLKKLIKFNIEYKNNQIGYLIEKKVVFEKAIEILEELKEDWIEWRYDLKIEIIKKNKKREYYNYER